MKFSWSVILLVLLLPFSVFWPLAKPIEPEIFEWYVTPGLYLTDLAVAAVVITGMIARKQQVNFSPPNRSQNIISILLLSICLSGLLTAPFAISKTLAFYTSLRWIWAFLLYWILIHHDLQIERLSRYFIVGLCLHALVGLIQFMARRPLGLPGELALEVDQFGAARIAAGGVRWLRAYGLTFHPNVLGGFLMAGLILSLPMTRRLSTYLAWILIGLGLLLSFSRSAWLATGVVLPFIVHSLLRDQPIPKKNSFPVAGRFTPGRTCWSRAPLVAPFTAFESF
jgi:hypothetical protein